MAKRQILLSLAPALFLAALLVPRPSSAAVPRFGTMDVTVLAGQSIDGAKGSPNPFTDITLTAAVTAPSGKQYTVTGFFDGDGQGGMAGRVFKVRVFADETGTWTWRTSSNRADLNNQSGSFTCSGALSGPFAAGPVGLDPASPYRFRYRQGAPVYLLGKFLDEAAPNPIRYSHTFFSEQLTDANRDAMLLRHRAMRLNKMNVYLANKGDYDGVSTTPWLGSAGSNDKTRFDLARWHRWENWMPQMRDGGMLAELWFFADDSSFGSLSEADQLRLIQYGMARMSGYVNTMFILALEWQEGWSAAQVQSHLEYLRQNNPWGRLASVHGLTGNFTFPTASWVDYMDLQAGNDVNADTVYAMGILHRAMGAKPLLQEEFGLGTEDGAGRQKAWAAFFAGAAGSGTGAYLEPFARFVAVTPFEKLAPAPQLVASGQAWALAEPGKTYLFYLPAGGTVRADLTGAAGQLVVQWFDPRSGLFNAASTVNGGAVRSFTAPGNQDWVLSVRAPGTPVVRPVSFYTVHPCRALDTRTSDSPLSSGDRRSYALVGSCGIPAGAQAVAVNLAAISPGSVGYITLWPGNTDKPVTTSLSFDAGDSQSNNAIVALGSDGAVLAEPLLASGTVDLVLDVTGYFVADLAP
jgi:Domain of unknown function (DUF5060)/Putative collagen-binding domain of a collagenase